MLSVSRLRSLSCTLLDARAVDVKDEIIDFDVLMQVRVQLAFVAA